MKKHRLWIVLGALVCVAVIAALLFGLAGGKHRAYEVNKNNTENFGALLNDLMTAYENPQAEDAQTVAADLAAIRRVDARDHAVASAIADHWQRVYLDPDYELYLHRDDGETAKSLAAVGVPDSRSHAIVVLGYELKNGQMQPELVGRCEAAAALARAFPSTILVCSGGATGSDNPDKHTEAGLMKDYLVEHCGIEAARIFTDERAMTTAENAVNSFQIMQEQKVQSMTIVTSSYHQRWGQALYNLLAEIYRQEHGYSAEIIGNYCYDIEPAVPAFAHDDRIAMQQIAGILKLPRVALPTTTPPSPTPQTK
ncbi:MAG: YdcF family protein [Oscillospiraceae bacterium]|nr:YdcF family protein [Oscillospiraceae bacterium]